MAIRYLIYILYFNQNSFEEAFKKYGNKSWAKLMYIPTTKYLENYFYLNVDKSDWKNYEYIGTLSWKAHEKTFIPENFDEALEDAKKNNFDFIYLKYNTKHTHMFDNLRERHYFFAPIWTGILKTLGFDAQYTLSENIREFCCNYWIATPEVIEKYAIFLEQVQVVMETNENIKKLLELNSNYEKRPSENYLKITGKRFYMYHPFILERMPCFYIYHEKIKSIPMTRLLLKNFIQQPIQIHYKKKHLIIHITSNQDVFKFIDLNSDFEIIFIFSENLQVPSEFNHAYIIKIIGGVYEAWSDIILAVDRDYYQTITLSKNIDLQDIVRQASILKNCVDDSLVLASFASNKEGYNENCFCFSKQALPVLKYTMFHPIIHKEDKILIKTQTITQLFLRGFDVCQLTS